MDAFAMMIFLDCGMKKLNELIKEGMAPAPRNHVGKYKRYWIKKDVEKFFGIEIADSFFDAIESMRKNKKA